MSRSAVGEATTTGRLSGAIDAAAEHLLGLQHEAGYWWGELESNVSITAEHVFLRHVLGIPDAEELAKVARYLLSMQRHDGTWGNWYESVPDLSTTIEAYTALKMAGVSPAAPQMQAARAYILAQGGAEKARVFTKIWLAMMGEWDWRGVPVLPVEFVLLPAWSPMSIYSFGCWARQTIVPLAIVMAKKPVVPLPAEQRVDELFVDGRERADLRVPVLKRTLRARFFMAADKLLRLYDRLPVKPGRQAAIRKAERWIVERQEADGAWGGIQPPWVYSLIALRLVGYEMDHPVMRRGLAAFYGPQRVCDRRTRAAFVCSPAFLRSGTRASR